MKKLLFLLYQNIPTKLRYAFAGSPWTKLIRDKVLRTKDGFKTTSVSIERDYNRHRIAFEFIASIAVAAKAVKKGVENALLRKSIEVLETRLENASKDAVIIDVGGNFGFLSLVWAQYLYLGKGVVHTFEPELRLASCIEQSVQKNQLEKKLVVHKKGVAAQKGIINLYTFFGGASGNPEQGFSEIVKVPTISLDDFVVEQNLQRVDLIKIDVDSIEFQILEGAEATIAKYRPAIFTETNGNPAIIQLLKDWSYEVFDIYGNQLSEDQLPHDILALPIR